MATAENPQLERGLGLKEAVALNMIEIVGIGPFVVSGIVIQKMGGPQALLAWVAGAVLATLDAFVWSELGAAMPKAGGSYVFLREAYGPLRWGRLMSFLFVWQTFVQAPLSVASASIGFTRYAGYLHPLSALQAKAVSGGLVIFLVILLYRRITTIGKISLLLWAGVIATLLWLIWGGMTHFNAKMAFDFPPNAFSFSWVWFAGLGSAMVSTIYSYWGYYNICHLGGEIKEPEKNIPRGIFLIGAGYYGSVSGDADQYFGRDSVAGSAKFEIYCEHVRGATVRTPGRVAGYRHGVVDCAGFGIFGAAGVFAGAVFRSARRKLFSDIRKAACDQTFSAHFVAGVGSAGIFLQREAWIWKRRSPGILAVRLIVQFIGQAVGVMLLRKRLGTERLPFKMWLYPVPAILTMIGWAWLFWHTGAARKWGLLEIVMGVLAFLVWTATMKQWPFEKNQSMETAEPVATSQ